MTTQEPQLPDEEHAPSGAEEPPRSPLPSSNARGLVFAVLAALLMLGLAIVAATSSSDVPEEAAISAQPYINVQDYGAKGDGVTDDTQAIRAAIEENIGRPEMQTLFFPAGIYLVSDRLAWWSENGTWQPYLTLQGASQDSTTIRLKDNSPGYDDPDDPKALIYTASGLFVEEADGGGRDYIALGEGNEAFRNFIYDLTIDTGSGNPGAIGIDFLGNNIAGIRRVSVRSGDGDGIAGIAMTRRWVGPALLKDISVSGFDYGISVDQTEYGLTFENIDLDSQKSAGIRNDSNVLSIRNLKSDNGVPALLNQSSSGLIVLIDGELNGRFGSGSAILNDEGELYLRNVTTSGYEAAVRMNGKMLPGTSVSEYSSGGAIPPGGGSLGLAIAATPEPEVEPVELWVSVTDFGARAYDSDGEIDYGDDTQAVQRAIDSGATTIYFPPGRYYLNDTIYLRRNLQRIEFRGSVLGVSERNAFGDGRPVIRVADGRSQIVVFNQLGEFDSANLPEGGGPMIKHASARSLVILDSFLSSYRSVRGAGPLYLENVCCGPMHFDHQEVWARQLDVEVDESPMITNVGGNLWVLGLKTERPRTVIATRGGSTEVLGGLVYPVQDVAPDEPGFVNEDARQSLVYAVSAHDLASNYTLQSLLSRDGITKRLLSREAIQRGLYGSFVFQLQD